MSFCQIMRRAAVSGSTAAMTSAGAAMQLANVNGQGALSPVNAVTHCLWPATAYEQRKFSFRYTLTGAAIHLGSSIFWGCLFESLRGARRAPMSDASAAAATAAIAYVVDYHVVPGRVTPGFEAHIPRRSFTSIYAALGLGLLLAATINR